MDNVRKHFEEEANEYNNIIINLIPYYNEMLEALISSIQLNTSDTFSLLDLGCGPGTITKLVLKKYPKAKVTCVDIASNMIELAEKTLGEYKDIEFINKDFYNLKLSKKYDVVLSSLALHHLLNNDDKKAFYNKIYGWLNNKGSFFNADNVIASGKRLDDTYMEKWIEYMNRNVSMEEINSKWLVKYADEDKPAILFNQLLWLKDIGFKEVDVIWKYYNFSVYGGYK